MVISFLNVSGECFLAEAFTGGAPSATHAGMTWRGMGPCVVTTGPTGKATISVNSSSFDLGPNSWVKIDTSVGGIRRFLPQGKDIRHLVGHLWLRVSRDPCFDEDIHGGGGGGVRG